MKQLALRRLDPDRSRTMPLWRSVILSLVCIHPLISQVATPQPSTPSVGDPAVFYMFLLYHHSLVQDVQAAPATQQAVAQSLGLSVADFTSITPVYQSLASALSAIDVDANAYRDAVTSGNQLLNIASIQQFSARRNQAVAQARLQLQSGLTTSGWAVLSAFIEGAFRQTIVKGSVGQ